jgi:hypothetical protein
MMTLPQLFEAGKGLQPMLERLASEAEQLGLRLPAAALDVHVLDDIRQAGGAIGKLLDLLRSVQAGQTNGKVRSQMFLAEFVEAQPALGLVIVPSKHAQEFIEATGDQNYIALPDVQTWVVVVEEQVPGFMIMPIDSGKAGALLRWYVRNAGLDDVVISEAWRTLAACSWSRAAS